MRNVIFGVMVVLVVGSTGCAVKLNNGMEFASACARLKENPPDEPTEEHWRLAWKCDVVYDFVRGSLTRQ